MLNMRETAYPKCLTFGMDPEIFIEKDGKVIGAEKIMPKEGKPTLPVTWVGIGSEFSLDGVQLEYNPYPFQCRESMGSQISHAFKVLHEHLSKMDGMKVCFRSNVEVDPEEFDSLSPNARMLGCAPSMNYYNPAAVLDVDPMTYRKRSAGGHIHMGGFGLHDTRDYQRRAEVVPIMDIIVANTCVMLDRDPLAAERRKVYGRAGEFRLPDHGLEYRTLSNFWLQAYPLMHLVLGLTRLAAGIALGTGYDSVSCIWGKWNPREALLSKVDLEAVQHAINFNDLALAKQNWKAVRDYIDEHVSVGSLTYAVLPQFDYFLRKVENHGLKYWFKEDPLSHWLGFNGKVDGKDAGWESFLIKTVKNEMNGSTEHLEDKVI